MNLNDLNKELPYKWRVQSFSKFKPQGQCVAYIDARDVQKRLDEVCGKENWQTLYYEVGSMLFCKIGININAEWVWKSDTGSESNIEKEKGHSSDAFKRAAVLWGVGRFLYDMKIQYVAANEVKTDKPPIVLVCPFLEPLPGLRLESNRNSMFLLGTHSSCFTVLILGAVARMPYVMVVAWSLQYLIITTRGHIN